MESPEDTKRRAKRSVRIALAPDEAEALERRAHRNDRFAWLEAGRIVREALVRDGDITEQGER